MTMGWSRDGWIARTASAETLTRNGPDRCLDPVRFGNDLVQRFNLSFTESMASSTLSLMSPATLWVPDIRLCRSRRLSCTR